MLKKYMDKINRKLIIGLVSSIITAAMGYGLRLILLNYLEYDVFTNLDNVVVSLSYFCSLGGIRFIINELIENFSMFYCGGTIPVSNSSGGSDFLPIRNNSDSHISSMQAPQGEGIGSSGTGNSSGTLSTDDRLKLELEQRIVKVQGKLEYFEEQFLGAKQDLDDILSNKHIYIQRNLLSE